MRFFTALIIVLTFLSCIHRRVHKSLKKISPYHTNDIIVFENPISLKKDTFFVAYSGDAPERDRSGRHFINRHTYICQTFSSDIMDEPDFRLNPCLIEILPNYNPNQLRPKTNGIYFKVYSRSFRLHYFISFSELNSKDTISVTIDNKTFKDVYEIKIDPQQKEDSFKGNVAIFYWSKHDGYLKFITFNKNEYKLINKFNDEKTVEKIRQSEKQKVDNSNKH